MTKRNRDQAVTAGDQISDHGDKPKIVQSRPAVRIEHPREGEVVAHPSYTFHIAAAPAAEGVEVSINQGEWIACREALGLWWFDWIGYKKGEYELAARTRVGAGISAPRRFLVD